MQKQEEKAAKLHGGAIVVDTHCDTLMKFLRQPHGMPPARKLGERADWGHIDLPRRIEGGVTCQTFAVYTGRRAVVPEATLMALQMVDKFYSEVEANDGSGSTPEGLEDVSRMPNMTRVMVKRGYSDEDILKILGGNHLRVYKQVIG